ncbi:protein FAR1-RELATED SEQUENCE 5-like [Olea europaea var. sylvestris]|uniref:protein FAR1-RELATED SEQUENCE 5-like n=1 Tax=Olea europaea var. sylvestris TaxID=158386 RepID=UPI000C1D5168|nr:protein FAR1-RELATED SEQUENCE 5-like [Olea europaea var. sylvestris]
MMFNDDKEVYDFYKRYAYDVGFPVRKRNSKKGDDGLLKYATFTCSHEGRRPSNASGSLNPQPISQTDCKARISASLDSHGMWRINTVHLDHNHRTSPSKSRLYRCNRELSATVKRKLEVNDFTGIPLHKSFNSTVVEAGGYENMTCVEKDCRNYIEQVRRLRLGEGDVAAIQSYFSKMQARCSGFYFSMDVDDEFCPKNVFWSDNRCRQAYMEFGDVVTFDTTYFTNKYDMPFAPFVGVNHHGQSTLFGCGLLSNEDTDTFVWLFKTWLECMHGRAPRGIITDQDRAMQNAIEIVFPDTRHRWCLWHILKKLPEKFGYHVDKASIFSAIHQLVYDSQNIEEFELGWKEMIETYELIDNEWLSGLYVNRGRWVPCFLKMAFWVGMSTTQQSESMNAFFDDYVHLKTSLKQFVEQYKRTLRSKVEKEFQADFKSYSQTLLEHYTLRRWRRDVSRAYTRVAMNYDGLVSTPEQLRYDSMCKAFAEVADLAADNECRARAILDWIKVQANELKSTKSCIASNIVSHCTPSQIAATINIWDPNVAKKKGAPRRLRRKSPLELKNLGASLTTSKGKRLRQRHSNTEEAAPEFVASQEQSSTQTPFSYSQLLLGDAESFVCTRPLPTSDALPPLPTNVIFRPQGDDEEDCLLQNMDDLGKFNGVEAPNVPNQ